MLYLVLLLVVTLGLTGPGATQGAAPPPSDPTAAPRTSAEIGAGGLLFVPDDRLVIASQDVTLSPKAVRVTYAVRNRDTEPLTRLIAWPMPEIDLNALGEERPDLASPDVADFAQVRVSANGAPVTLGIEQRAWAFGRDITDLLTSLKVPTHPFAPGIGLALESVPLERRRELEERGIVRTDDSGRLAPQWTVKTTAFWRQLFAPGETVTIVLGYVPVAGRVAITAETIAVWRNSHCLSAEAVPALEARVARGGAAHRITYTTGNEPGWWTEVAAFRLAIEKPTSETIVGLCGHEMRPVGGTAAEWLAVDHKPGDDIKVLIVE